MNPPIRIGAYRIERLLGVGSFATVWLGFDPALDARVAIKVLADNWSHDLRVRERFLEEGRLLWRLDHERLVRVHATGELDDGRPYLVMAWAEGGSLRDRLAAGPLRVDTGLGLLREIAAGVAVLHDHGIVHRDLTPGNILFRTCLPGAGPAPGTAPAAGTGLPPAGAGPGIGKGAGAGLDTPVDQVVIADLGLAKALAAASGLTARAGTPGFMAPEQDDPLAVVDARADVFGLGRLGATLLAAPGGARPTTATLREGVPPGVAGVLRKATARLPADRYPDAATFAVALDRATNPPGWSRTTRRHAIGTAVAVLAAAAALAADVVVTPRDAPASARDSTRRITVVLPAGWRAGGSGWQDQRDADGGLAPALLLSPEPRRWQSDPAVPGAFVGVSRDVAARLTPSQFLDGRPHAECIPSPPRVTRQAGIDWVVVEFTACQSGKPVIVEAAGMAPNGAGLVYVQVAPPASGGPGFVETLLAGVRVRP